MKKVYILQGLPASGKSTWAKAYCEKNLDWVRVNRDALRHMRGTYWLPKQEKMITQWEQACILEALASGKNVIVDATNLNPKHYKNLKAVIKRKYPDTQITTRLFRIEVEEAIKRDLKRPDSVGEKVIRRMYNTYFKPDDVKLEQNPDLFHAIICDLDGTLADMNGRDPYNASTCENDILNKPVAKIIRAMQARNYKVIFLSGRENKYREETKRWLEGNGFIIDGDYQTERFKNCFLYLRATGDNRKDSIIKQELFEANIKDKFYVEFILDDRNQVVDMWRSIGLTCLQVNYGDF